MPSWFLRYQRVHGEIVKLLGARLNLVNVGLSRALISGHKKGVDLSVLGQPRSHLAKFLAQARDSLVIHVGLRNEFRHSD